MQPVSRSSSTLVSLIQKKGNDRRWTMEKPKQPEWNNDLHRTMTMTMSCNYRDMLNSTVAETYYLLTNPSPPFLDTGPLRPRLNFVASFPVLVVMWLSSSRRMRGIVKRVPSSPGRCGPPCCFPSLLSPLSQSSLTDTTVVTLEATYWRDTKCKMFKDDVPKLSLGKKVPNIRNV